MRAASFVAALVTGSALVAGIPSRASAQQAPQVEKWIGVDLLTSALDADAADVEGIGGRGWGAQVNFGVTAMQFLTARVDLGVVGLRDKRRFTEETTNGEMTSGTSGGLATLAVGLRTPRLPLGPEVPGSLSAGANVGHSWIDANRTISTCIDCTAEDVKIEGGNFWEAGVQFDTRGRSGVAVRFRSYGGSSDLRDAIMIGWNRRL